MNHIFEVPVPPLDRDLGIFATSQSLALSGTMPKLSPSSRPAAKALPCLNDRRTLLSGGAVFIRSQFTPSPLSAIRSIVMIFFQKKEKIMLDI